MKNQNLYPPKIYTRPKSIKTLSRCRATERRPPTATEPRDRHRQDTSLPGNQHTNTNTENTNTENTNTNANTNNELPGKLLRPPSFLRHSTDLLIAGNFCLLLTFSFIFSSFYLTFSFIFSTFSLHFYHLFLSCFFHLFLPSFLSSLSFVFFFYHFLLYFSFVFLRSFFRIFFPLFTFIWF